ncbi:hypothetical protein Indivirus_6_6 [Indivirus ILV1]|uniref:Uncharacterized protein n=1 Tax=Indivirus ILV1 TaxID=1977633 RepID=A0A1V0SDY7_9VIRU|nr:hypothetical protein Indivirus_6_6 [Indivirus ILV1]
MEEVPFPNPAGNQEIMYDVNINSAMIPQLLEIIKKNYNSVDIKTSDGKLVGSLPETLCLMFEYYSAMQSSSFLESKSDTKVMTMHPDFTEEQCYFFVEVIPKILIGKLDFSIKKIIWLFKFFDILLINDNVGNMCLSNIPINYNNSMAFLSQAVEECSGKNQGKYLGQILNIASKNLILDIVNLPGSLLTYPLGRNSVVKLLKDNKYKCTTEMNLFMDLFNRIREINKLQPNHKISFKAFLDIMACIRWFYIDEEEINRMVPTIKSEYPNFEISNLMASAFKRRKQLVSKYSKENRKTFKYNHILFGTLDARDIYAYSQYVTFNTPMEITMYTTTECPILITFKLYGITKKRSGQKFHIIESSIPDLFISFKLQNIERNITIKKKWTFSNGKKLFIVPTNPYITEFVLTVDMAYISNVNSQSII